MMSDIQLAHLSFGGETRDRSRDHQIAIRDARIAADFRGGTAPEATRPSFIQRFGLASRVRLALAGGAVAAPDACNCPA